MSYIERTCLKKAIKIKIKPLPEKKAAVVYIWNGTIPKPHIHKDWQWPVATWFNQLP
jgi:hypothetical protein